MELIDSSNRGKRGRIISENYHCPVWMLQIFGGLILEDGGISETCYSQRQRRIQA